MTKVLVLTSDIKTSTVLRFVLTMNNFDASVASNTTKAEKHLHENHFNLIVMDIHSLDENAFTYARELRGRGMYIPVLFLGERSYEDAINVGCSGLDDYLLKPYTFPDLKKKIMQTLSKTHSAEMPLLWGGINVDTKRRMLWAKDKFVHLGKTEMRILLLLARKTGRVVTLSTMYSHIETDSQRRINTRLFSQIASLRQKLEQLGAQTLQINFVKDGYRLDIC